MAKGKRAVEFLIDNKLPREMTNEELENFATDHPGLVKTIVKVDYQALNAHFYLGTLPESVTLLEDHEEQVEAARMAA